MNENKDKLLFSKLSDVLDEGTVYTAHNKKIGDIQVRHGNKSKGLVHIISRRYSERVLNKSVQMPLEKTQTEITAICFLIANSLDKGNVRTTKRGNWEIENKGIKAIIDKDKEGKFVLTGYDDNKNKTEATDSINAVIAKYKYAPEFLEMYAQVGAVIASINKITQNQNLSNQIQERFPSRWIEIDNENGLKKISLVDGHPTISQSEKSEAGIVRNISTLSDNLNISQPLENSTIQSVKLSNEDGTKQLFGEVVKLKAENMALEKEVEKLTKQLNQMKHKQKSKDDDFGRS